MSSNGGRNTSRAFGHGNSLKEDSVRSWNIRSDHLPYQDPMVLVLHRECPVRYQCNCRMHYLLVDQLIHWNDKKFQLSCMKFSQSQSYGLLMSTIRYTFIDISSLKIYNSLILIFSLISNAIALLIQKSNLFLYSDTQKIITISNSIL